MRRRALRQSKPNGYVLIYILILSAMMLALLGLLFTVDTLMVNRIVQRNAALQAQALADAGIEQSLLRLRANSSFAGESFALGVGTVQTVVVASGSDRIITATGTVAGTLGGDVERTRQIRAYGDPDAAGQAFAFAVQSDTGGFETGQNRNPDIGGNLYSNGDIKILGNGAKVSGNASAVGTITNNGTISGTITQGAPVQPMPPIDAEAWRTEAAKGQTHTGDYVIASNATYTLGAPDNIGVITGRLLISGNATITLTGPLWIKGGTPAVSSMEISANPNFILQDSISQSVIVADGRLSFSGNARFEADSDSDLLVMTTYPNSYTPTTTAVALNANTRFINAALYAPNGQISIGQSASGLSISSFAAGRIFVDSNAKIDYATGLVDASFNPSGPTGGSFFLSGGTYQNLTD